MPRLGYMVRVPQQYANFTYYGRGPIDNYADRKVGQFIEQHKNTVAGEFVNFPKPQDMGNHEDVRWCALTNNAGNGAVFIATDRLSASALPYSALRPDSGFTSVSVTESRWILIFTWMQP